MKDTTRRLLLLTSETPFRQSKYNKNIKENKFNQMNNCIDSGYAILKKYSRRKMMLIQKY